MRVPPVLQWLLACGAAGAATALGHLLDPHMSVAGLAMVYLLAVVLASIALDRGPALLAAALGVSALNFFFVPPRYSFDVDGAEYWWTLAVLLGLAATLQALIVSLRERTARAELGEARAAQLHALSELLAQQQGSGHAAMAQSAAAWLHAHLQRPCAVFVRDAGAAAPACFAAGAPAEAFHLPSVQWAIEHGRPLGRGSDDWPDLALWCAPLARIDACGAMQVLLEATARPARDLQGHWLALVRQVGLSVDRERAAQAARTAQASAEAESVRNTLLASLSHDLRTPLAGILGNASALRSQGEAIAERQRDRLLANLENDARDMTLMADNILQLARLSQPQLQLRRQWESLEEVLDAAVTRMRRRWPQARITLRVTQGLPPLQAEAALLAQLIANLVDNAVRHGGDAPDVVVRAGRSRDGVFVAVRDHGGGLPPGDLRQLFDRYRQGDPASRGAAGLGLAICSAIAQAHAARIEAKRCDPGTEFRIDFPVTQPQELSRGPA